MAKSDFETATPRPYIQPSTTSAPNGVVGPALAGRHDVAVGVERDRRAAAPKRRRTTRLVQLTMPLARTSASGTGCALDREAQRLEQRRRARGVGGAVAGRVVGGDLDQLGQEGLGAGRSRVEEWRDRSRACRHRAPLSAGREVAQEVERGRATAVPASSTVMTLGRVVADAALAADEQHADRAQGGHRQPVMAGAARQAQRADAGARRPRPRAAAISAGVAGARPARRSCARAGRRRRAGRRCRAKSLARSAAGVVRGRRRSGARRSSVKRTLARDDVDRAGRRLEPADGGRPGRRVAGATRSTASTISAAAASASWRRPIGTVPAWPASPVTSTVKRLAAVDRGDDADRQALGLEHRPLLDVHLDIGEHVLAAAARRSAMRGRIAAERRERLADA